MLVGFLPPVAALAATEVELLATEPSGGTVTLGANQNFYLRIGFRTDEPVRIWVRPYFQGREVNAGSHPSRLYDGEGEALAWFFFLGGPGGQVDEIRVSAGDGTTNGTRQIASWPVRIAAGSAPAVSRPEPAWLTRLRADDERRASEENAARMSEPVSAGDIALFSGFMLLVVALGVGGILAPLVAIRRWQGGWRLAATVPAAIVAFVVLRIVVGTARDPTSHNLWPFEILLSSVLALVLIGALVLARKLAGARLERR